jgi:hypothetical protein
MDADRQHNVVTIAADSLLVRAVIATSLTGHGISTPTSRATVDFDNSASSLPLRPPRPVQ